MPRPVAVFNGETNSPIDWRMPIVTIRNAAPVRITIQIARGDVVVVILFPGTFCAWRARRAKRGDGTPSHPVKSVQPIRISRFLAEEFSCRV
jgi:hypothetical protein